MKPVAADTNAIDHAADLLRQGRLVAFPTETVYGLGADASNPDAVQRIFEAKGRPADHPLIVHMGSIEILDDWALDVPESARKLAAHFWPGPLAIILNKRPEVPLAVTGGQNTVGLRVPDHPVALRLLKAFGGGVAAPSANRFCRISPTKAVHVEQELGSSVDMILDGGTCQVGVESTIVDLSVKQPRLLRPGHITQEQIEAVLKIKLQTLSSRLQQKNNPETRAPGMLDLHYAPSTQAFLFTANHLSEILKEKSLKDKKIGILSYTIEPSKNRLLHIVQISALVNPYAQSLYTSLRKLDSMKLDMILVEQPPQTAEWRAINDRLCKATSVYQN